MLILNTNKRKLGLIILVFFLGIISLLSFKPSVSAQTCTAVCQGPYGDDHCTLCDSSCASNFCPAAPGTCVTGTYGTLAGSNCGYNTSLNPLYPLYSSTKCLNAGYGGKWCEQWQGCCIPCNGDPSCTVNVTPTTSGGGCTRGTWTNQTCGGTSGSTTCAPTEMLQTRTVSPSGCDTTARCVAGYPACTGTPSSCSFSVNDITLNGTGDSLPNTLYNIVETGSTIGTNDVTFTPFDPAKISTTTPDNNGAPYTTTVTAKAIGTTSVLVRATMNNAVFCQNTFGVTISNPTAWMQGGIGDIVAGTGNVSSQIPAVCTDPVDCVLITGTSSLNPGAVQAGGSISPGNGEYSYPDPPYNWSVPNSPYAGVDYDYSFFDTKTSGKTFVAPNATLSNGTADAAGYKWLKSAGAFTISSDINLGTNKVILFVNGDLNINGKINLTSGRGFFMAVVNGNINVKGSVGGAADATPDLQGLFFADQTFTSAVIDPAPQEQLHVQGMVVANAFNLNNRSLADNSSTPAEFFEFSPALLLQLPASLGSKQIIWKEVAP